LEFRAYATFSLPLVIITPVPHSLDKSYHPGRCVYELHAGGI
jgi:hypothetical protein